MKNLIKPKKFLLQLKNDGTSAMKITPSDLIEVAELDLSVPFSEALDTSKFYDILKKAVSDFNSNAALNGKPSVDFDDLHTKYSEYIEALKLFVQESV